MGIGFKVGVARFSGFSPGQTGRHFPRGHFPAGVTAAVSLVSFLALGACAIAPVQQNVTGLPIVRIVNHIRCETRVAIQKKAIDELRKYYWQKYRTKESPLAAQLERYIGQRWYPNMFLSQLDKEEIAFYNHYIGTGVAYNFSFDISEDNKASLVADPVRLITNGMLTVNMSASGEFTRDNQRSFVVSETFAKLLYNKIHGCSEENLPNENFAYPIAGTVGIDELISTFIDLNEDENLSQATAATGSDSNPATADPATKQAAMTGGSSTSATAAKSSSKAGTPAVGSGTFSDTLNYTTILMGGVTPSLQINPIGKQWGLAGASDLGFTATRTDHHNLTIGLSLAKPGESMAEVSVASTNPRASVLVTSGRLAPSAFQRHNVTRAEQRALDAMTQQRIDNYLIHFSRF